MRWALITDVHANREAFEAVLEHASGQSCSRYAFLGDFVGYGADPAWVVEHVRERVDAGAIAVQGNHDASVAGQMTHTMVPAARQAVEWTRSQLDTAQIDFLRNLPMHRIEGEMLFVHANAFAPARWEYILGRGEAERSLRATECVYTFCGHVHEPHLYHLRATADHCEAFLPTAGIAVPVPSHRRWLVLPGSVGQSRDGNPAASYATLDLPARSLTFHRVPYDHDTTAAKIRAAGLPDALANRLSDGH